MSEAQAGGQRRGPCGGGVVHVHPGVLGVLHRRRRLRRRGVHTGDVPGLSATGRSFRVVGSGVGEVRVGLIVHATEYFNMADLLTQVGILPPPPG